MENKLVLIIGVIILCSNIFVGVGSYHYGKYVAVEEMAKAKIVMIQKAQKTVEKEIDKVTDKMKTIIDKKNFKNIFSRTPD